MPPPTAAQHSTLEQTHNVLRMKIISSSQISARVSSVLKHLQSPPTTIDESPPTSQLPLVVLTAQGFTTNKLVTVVEIVRRQLIAAGTTTLYQYNQLGSVTAPAKPKVDPREAVAAQEGDLDEAGIEEDAFEPLALPEREQVVPVLMVYLCCSPVDALRKMYGYA